MLELAPDERDRRDATLMPNETPTARSAPTVSPFELLAVVWRHKLIVGLVLILSIGASVVMSSRASKQYSSSSQLLFRDPGFAAALFGSNLFEPGQDPKRDLQTDVNVVSSRNVALVAQKNLQTNDSVGSLLNSISVEPSTDSNVVSIKATRSTPGSAAAVANAFANGYIEYRKDTDRQAVVNAENLVQQSIQATTDPDEKTKLEGSLRQLKQLEALQTGDAEVIANALPNDTPVSPRPKRNAILAALLGLLLGSALALLVDFLDRRVKSVEDFERAYPGYPVIATVPRYSTAATTGLDDLTGPVGEAYRMLREGLRFLDPDGLARCFVMASAVESEGKSTVAVHLAKSLAAVGQRVILVEADMRRPTAAAQLGVHPAAAGLSNLLVADGYLDRYLVDILGDDMLRVLPAGTLPPSPADLLRSGRLADVLASARESADVVIVDPPPLLPVSDTRVVLQLDEIDGVVVVGRVGTTRRDRARETMRILHQSGRRVFGLVITGGPNAGRSSYYDKVFGDTSMTPSPMNGYGAPAESSNGPRVARRRTSDRD
jgi:capsular exopolysaccharide synthesis family protein